MSADFVIVGGGIIGLLQARELVLAGASVTLLERGLLAREASWAGGGIVSPLYPWRYSPPITALASWAQDFYPALAEELNAATGIDPEFIESGLLMLDGTDDAQALAWSARFGRRAEHLSPEAVEQLQPGLGPPPASGIWMPGIAQVCPPRLTAALRAWLTMQPGVSIRQHCDVLGFRNEGRRVRGVDTTQGFIDGGVFVLCAGAWSESLTRMLGWSVPIEPVRGQMLMFAGGPAELTRMVMRGGRYLIPRRDGQVLVGSTLEHAGFERLPTAEAQASLLASALSILPALRDYPLAAQWTGLRPGSPSGIPLIGWLPDWQNVAINAGHFRNGVVLAPAATRLLSDLLQRHPTIVDPKPYAPSVQVRTLEV